MSDSFQSIDSGSGLLKTNYPASNHLEEVLKKRKLKAKAKDDVENAVDIEQDQD